MITTLLISVFFFLVLVFLREMFFKRSRDFFSRQTWRDAAIEKARRKRIRKYEKWVMDNERSQRSYYFVQKSLRDLNPKEER
jgi:hypothetical protein